jgi:DNA-binding MarR family transcriptional regulator
VAAALPDQVGAVQGQTQAGGEIVRFNVAAALVTICDLYGKATPAVLPCRLFLEPHPVSELVIRMEKKGLIIKKRNKKRENVVRTAITEKGRRFCQQAVQPGFIQEIIASLSEEQQNQLRTCLRILYEKALRELGIAEEAKHLK